MRRVEQFLGEFYNIMQFLEVFHSIFKRVSLQNFLEDFMQFLKKYFMKFKKNLYEILKKISRLFKENFT